MATLELLNGGNVHIQQQIHIFGLPQNIRSCARGDPAVITIVPHVLVPHICRVMTFECGSDMDDNGLENICCAEARNILKCQGVREFTGRARETMAVTRPCAPMDRQEKARSPSGNGCNVTSIQLILIGVCKACE